VAQQLCHLGGQGTHGGVDGRPKQKLRTLKLGDFRTLAFAMLTDAAMMQWLDAQTNTAKSANENLAREFMELFALGHGNGYTESDVRNGARALTGGCSATEIRAWCPSATMPVPRPSSVLVIVLGLRRVRFGETARSACR
jgi:uncharacterized protein (DUF1800 family)